MLSADPLLLSIWSYQQRRIGLALLNELLLQV